MKPMIEISNITKKYKETTALNEISLMNETRLRRKLKILFKTTSTTMWSEHLICRNCKMAKSLFEQLCGTYHEENGYLIPDLRLPDEEEQPIGIWGQRHMDYLKQ